jgi:hypothetical protein
MEALSILNPNKSMKSRKSLITDLFFFNRDLIELKNDLTFYEWDSEQALLTIDKKKLYIIITKFISKSFTYHQIEEWANMIECRDDIDFETEKLQQIIFELANPEINGEITKEKLLSILENLKLD